VMSVSVAQPGARPPPKLGSQENSWLRRYYYYIIIKGIYIAQVRNGHKCAMSAEMAVWLRNCLYLYSYLLAVELNTQNCAWLAVAAPEGRSRVGFSLCEAAERRRREERSAEGSRRRRREGRGAIGAEGVGYGEGYPLLSD